MENDVTIQDEERTMKLEKEKDSIRTLKDDLKDKAKKLEILEGKTKNLQDQLAAKSKQIKEIQQENKTLKSKVSSHTKQVDKLENQKSKLSNELVASKDQIKDVTEKLKQNNEDLQKARSHCEDVDGQLESAKKEITKKSKGLEKAEEEVRQFKKEKEEAIRDKEKVQKESEKQMNELCATLEKYKLENEKIVAQKERELELLRVKAEKESEEQNEKRLIEAKEQIENLERDMKQLKANQEKDKERLEFEKSETVDTLTRQLEAKNKEIKLLQEKVAENEIKPLKSPRLTTSSEEKLKTPKPMNPNTTPRDLAVVPETPKLPRGILKQNEVSQKKRRVAFAGSDEQRTSSSEEGDEKQVKSMTPKFDRKIVREKENQKSTPRANVRFSPKPSPWNNEPPREKKSPFTEVQKLKQIPRGKPMVPQQQKKLKIQSEESEEIAKFKELFPDMKSPDSLYDKSPGKVRGLHETMKPPFKSKITKIKPLSRRKKERQESTAWFDSDTLFGFGMDDE